MFQYRKATKNDKNDIILFLDLYLRKDYFFSNRIIYTMLSDKSSDIIWLSLYNNTIVGICITSKTRTLYNILIHPEYRKQGIGRKLIEISNPKKIRCKINMLSGDPREFYHKLGYGNCGALIKSKKSKKLNIQIMIKGGKVSPLF